MRCLFYFMWCSGLALPDKKILSHIWNKVSSGEPDMTLVLERKEGLEKYLQVIYNALLYNLLYLSLFRVYQ